MARSARGFIDQTEAAYLQQLLVGNDSRRKKIGLQNFSKLNRAGYRLRNPQPVGLLLRASLYDSDPKVVRWSLNALAFIASKDDVRPILDTIDRSRDDPDILASGIAALAATTGPDQLREKLADRDLPLEGAVLLAAAQKIPKLRTELARVRVKIDTAPVIDLRLAGVLVGLDKAPENLFAINHINADVLGSLNTHPDDIVAQYSIWALTENRKLSLVNLKIGLADAESQRANIRAYIYRLVAEDEPSARKNHDLMTAASMDDDPEVRESLARGLVGTYYDGLDELMTAWVIEEPEHAVREYVLEHMAAQAFQVPAYGDYVRQAWEAEPVNSPGRARMEAAARGTALGAELQRRKVLGEHANLQLGMGQMTNNFTFNGPASGAFSGSGSASAHDFTTITQMQAPQLAAETLLQLQGLLDADDRVAAEKKDDVAQVAAAPTKTGVQRILEWFKVAKEGGQLANATMAAAPAILDKLHTVAQHLPM